MNREEIYKLLQAISIELSESDELVRPFPVTPDWTSSLEDLQLDMITGQDFFRQLEKRIPTKRFRSPPALIDNLQNFTNLGELCDYLVEHGFEKPRQVEVVYVDDEPENLFIFKRRFGKQLNLKTFEDPRQALEHIIRSPNVTLVITDEVMPGLSGNQLCDEVHKAKPNIKFILITGNPNADEDLMYKSLRKNRFYEFINKPVDFEGKGEEYLTMIQGLSAFDW